VSCKADMDFLVDKAEKFTNFKSMFKLDKLVDLHMHLGSASTAHLLWELAHQRGVTLPEKNYWKFLELVKIDHKIDFQSYHNYFDMTQMIQSSPDSIEKSVHEAISLSYRKANCDIVEIRFNPMRRNKDGLYDLDRVIFSAIIGMKKACMIYPIKAGIIIEMDRRFSPKNNAIIIDKAIKFRNEGVVGIDLSGPNVEKFQIDDIIKPVEKAKSHGLGVTIHTGEAQPVEEMWEAVEKLKPDRVGHGIKAINDEKLMERLVADNIHLEICPTSNVILSIVKNWLEISKILDIFIDRGVKFNINSDGPVFYNTNVKEELQKLLDKEILTQKQVELSIKQAKAASFVKS
jgi:adenosine deaminase